MNRVSLIIAVALVAGVSCKEDSAPAAGSVNPRGGRPPGGSTITAKTGGDFAKLDAWAGAARPRNLAKKVDVATIEMPVADRISLGTFGGSGARGFRVTYNPSKNLGHESYRSIFVEHRVFEQAAEGLNRTIRLPTAVEINTVTCDTINAFYDPHTRRIIVCYELLDYFLEMFKATAKSEDELGNAVMGATMFGFFHEVGHGLIDLLELPAVGREEDSVDQLATLILIAAGDEGVAMAISGAYWFHLQSKDQGTPLWDEHGFDGQRFYNIMCLIYGSDPEKYADFVKSGSLPEERAQQCPEEYARITRSWEKLLTPHLTNGAALNIDYQPNVSPTSTTHGITCEQVAEKVTRLVSDDAVQEAESMSSDERAELTATLETELPAAREQVLAECTRDNWSDAMRTCVVDAKTLAQASTCD